MSVVTGATSPAESLPQEQQAARLLIDLLQQEQALLISADIDALALVTERKAPVIALMATLATQRHRALASAGCDASETGMQAWIDTQINDKPAHPQARTDWTTLLAMARQAQEINRINGLLINTHMARNQGALNVLRVRAGGGNFYGPDGQASAHGKGRGLALG